MPRRVVDGREVSYEDYGAGPVVLLIHGSPGNGKAWQRVGERLADRFRIVAPDLPGHGATTPQPAGAVPDVADAAALIEALIRAVGAPAVLAGHSYGGVVALAIALRGGVSLGALALLEPVAVSMLRMAGDREAYESTKAVFDAYIAGVEGGEPGSGPAHSTACPSRSRPPWSDKPRSTSGTSAPRSGKTTPRRSVAGSGCR